MSLIYSSGFLKCFHTLPDFVPGCGVSLEVSKDIVGHTLRELRHGARADTIAVDQSFPVQLIDEGKHIPEEITDLELELIMITVAKRFPDLLDLSGSAIEIVGIVGFLKPTVEFPVAFLEPEKSGESAHGQESTKNPAKYKLHILLSQGNTHIAESRPDICIRYLQIICQIRDIAWYR